tara:strand:+ start:13408 stop:14193 length:786 start_codon:yes stop_codon:yes gene_type:complete
MYKLTFITLLIYLIFPIDRLTGKIIFKDNNNFKKEFVFVKGGCFKMGNTFKEGDNNELPVHEVCVDDFYIGEVEVTQSRWRAVMGNNPSRFKDCDNCPVENVSWNDVQVFIKRINKITGKNYRLPTEAEWEYAARSGGKRERWAGTNRESELKEYAWYQRNSIKKTHPVKQKKRNGLGLYDMAGNVWEWVQDWYEKSYYKKSFKNNPNGPLSGDDKVLRGGSYFFTPRNIRTTRRAMANPDYRFIDIGFRLATSAKSYFLT